MGSGGLPKLLGIDPPCPFLSFAEHDNYVLFFDELSEVNLSCGRGI